MKHKACLSVRQGSILAYSLIILAAMLAITVGISTVSIMERKSAGGTDASVQSLQTADSGAQLAIKKLSTATSTTTIGSLFTCTSNGTGNPVTVNNQMTTGLAGNYTLTFYTNEEGTNAVTNCGAPANTVRNIKSVGKYSNTVRAVQVAVAQTGGGYDMQCGFGSNPGCCRMNKTNGETDCKWYNGTSWQTYSNDAFTATTAGNYSLACAMASGAWLCWRTDGTNVSICRQTTTGTWSNCTYPAYTW